MKKEKGENKTIKRITEWPFFRLLLTAISTILSILVLSFSSLIIVNAFNGNYAIAPGFLLGIFLSLGGMAAILWLKNRTKVSFIRAIGLVVFDVAIAIVVLFAKDNPFLFSLTAGLYCLTIVISRVFSIVQKPTVRNIIFNALIVSFAVFLGLGLMVDDTSNAENIQNVILVECLFIAVVSFIESMSVALAQLKVKVLVKIILNTFSLEVLFGLLVMIASFSFVLFAVEDGITSYADALWYCFAIVTTIGFGDIVATTVAGRILSVVLGMYGLVVVAVITSIIVNFYNETVGKKDAKELKDIKNDKDDNSL